MDHEQKFTISRAQAGQRLDIFCAAQMPDYSRAALQKAIRNSQITVNSDPAKPRYLVKEGDSIEITALTNRQAAEPSRPENLDLEILYEDENIVAINKPAGLLTHTPSHAPDQPSVATWFAERYPASRSVGEDPARPGIVHRLDKDTTGVLALAKTDAAHKHLGEQFKRHTAKKEYLALVFGVPGSPTGRITRPLARSRQNPARRTAVPKGLPRHKLSVISSKPAITEWQIEQKYNKFALLRVFPFTGRTHQIRVHLHHIGHPIVGDPLYNFKRQGLPVGISSPRGQLLHAEKLTLRLPSGHLKTISAPPPENFQEILSQLAQNDLNPR